MNSITYHTVPPQNSKLSYGSNDIIDFKTNASGRALLSGSVRLLGNVVVNNNTELNKTIFYDGFSGAHCFVDNIKTTFSSSGQVENLDHYARYVSSKAKASLTKNDLFNSVYACECRVPDNSLSNDLLKGYIDINDEDLPDISGKIQAKLDFALKLDFCLNNILGTGTLPFAKTGDVMVSIQTSSVLNSLWGDTDIGINTNYSLTNLRLVYTSVPDLNNGKYPQYTMRVKSSIKSSIQSSNSTITTKVPVVADSFFMTFISQADEGNNLVNSLQCQKIPIFQRLEVSYNDNISNAYTYELDNEEEVITNYIRAIQKADGNNDASLSTLASNESYGIGFMFGQFVNLANTKLGINLKSSIQSGSPFLTYMFFNGVISI